MPARVDRVMQLLLQLQTGKPFSGDQLANSLGVHKRTVFRDISLLRRYGVPIVLDLPTSTYSIPIQAQENLTSTERMELLAAAALSVAPERTQLRGAMNKLCRPLPRNKKRELTRLLRSFNSRIPASSSGAEQTLLMLVLLAIRQGLPLVIAEAASETSSTLLPRELAYETAGWRLRGFNVSEQREQDYWLSELHQVALREEATEGEPYPTDETEQLSSLNMSHLLDRR